MPPAAAATAGSDQSGTFFVPAVTNVASSLDAAGPAADNDAIIAETPGCMLYSFVVSTVLIGSLCFLGVAGNTAAFLVFQKDKLKTSTTFLFQVFVLLFLKQYSRLGSFGCCFTVSL
jgi:hypothetical protein